MSTPLADFLSENDISCMTCAHYTQNAPIQNTVRDVCGNLANKQTNVYDGQLLRLPPKGMCFRWEPV